MTEFDPNLFSDEIYGGVEEFTEDQLPEQMGAMLPPPAQPGRVKVTFPAEIKIKAFDFENAVGRLRVEFDANNPVLVTTLAGEVIPMRASFSTGPRTMGKERVVVPFGDGMYVARACGLSLSGVQSQRAWALLLAQIAGKTVHANVDWKVFCNPKKTRFIKLEEGGSEKDPNGVMGCGIEYAHYITAPKRKENGSVSMPIPKNADGKFSSTLECSCGAYLRVFPGLSNWEAIK